METRRRFRPGDFVLVAINAMFVAAGIVILPRDPNTGIVTLAFFGSCLALALHTLWRKYKAHAFETQENVAVSVAGGAPIRARRAPHIVLGLWIGALGLIIVVFGGGYPAAMRIIGAILLLVGFGLAGATFAGLLLRSHLQFDPDGLTIADKGVAATIAWDNIAGLAEAEVSSNPLVLITVHDPDRVAVAPAEKTETLFKRIGSARAFYGADFAVATTHYGFDAPMLIAAIAKYAREPEARAALIRHLT